MQVREQRRPDGIREPHKTAPVVDMSVAVLDVAVAPPAPWGAKTSATGDTPRPEAALAARIAQVAVWMPGVRPIRVAQVAQVAQAAARKGLELDSSNRSCISPLCVTLHSPSNQVLN